MIPSGNCTWTTGLNYTQTNSFTLQGAGAVSYSSSSISGSGTDSTIIQDDVNHGGSDPRMLAIATISGKSFRMTGIAFTSAAGNLTNPAYNGVVQISGASTSVRIDHNHFNQLYGVDLEIDGALNGVIDHNQFDAGFFPSLDEFHLRFGAGNWGGDGSGNGNGSWADTSHFGSSQFMFAEQNNFRQLSGSTHAFALDCVPAGRFVFRYNTLGYHETLQTHGTGSGNDNRGCRAYEFYNNTFTWSTNPTADQFAFLMQLESGSSLWWGNTVTGFITFIYADVVRVDSSTYTQSANPSGWGYCGTALGPSSWDQNSGSTGYACLDQVGRGKGDLLAGAFPNKVDSLTGTIKWPNQVSDPVYVWGNTYNPVPDEGKDSYWTNHASVTTENKDYYLDLPNYGESATFNGTAGVGQGLLSARPGTCTAGVAYWATDTTTLYQCASTNSWASYYTPYTYPHPLTAGTQGSGAPVAPTNVTAQVN